MDENIVLGPALIDSYKLESENAVNPRILLSNEVVIIVKKHINYYSDHESSPQNKEFLIDTDGFFFVNYLFILFYDNDYSEERIIEELAKHKEPIILNLSTNRNNFKLFEKYSWTANYHNYFCDNFVLERFPNINLELIKINQDLYRKHLMKII